MKKLSALLILLFAAGASSYYLYTSNSGFKTLADGFFQKYSINKNKTDEPIKTEAEPNVKNKETYRSKKKVYKKLKPDKYFILDEYARKCPKQYEKDISALSAYLIKPAKTEIEKVRVLFTWIATHIKYDDKAYNSGEYPDYTAEYVLSNRKAICEGYSNLFKALCNEAGIEAEKISGYAKGYGYKVGEKFTESNHAWNAVKIENKWRLFDVTWASGFGTNKNGKMVSKLEFDPFWFDVHPKAFLFTHLPVESKWQLTGSPVSLDKYERLPYLNSSFFKVGFNPGEIFTVSVTGKIRQFVEAFSTDFPVNASKLPYTKYLIKDRLLNFEIDSEYAHEIALIEDDKWYYFKKDGNKFSLSHNPAGKQIEILTKINSFDKNFYPILKYKVSEQDKTSNVYSPGGSEL